MCQIPAILSAGGGGVRVWDTFMVGILAGREEQFALKMPSAMGRGVPRFL